jgi:hypothetical protein
VVGLFAVVRRVVKRGADVAAAEVWEARHLVAKVHVWRRGRRAVEVAERKAAEAEVAGRMVGGCITSERRGLCFRRWTLRLTSGGRGLAAKAQHGERFRVMGRY